MKQGKYMGSYVMIACLSHKKNKQQQLLARTTELAGAKTKTSGALRMETHNKVLAPGFKECHSWVL